MRNTARAGAACLWAVCTVHGFPMGSIAPCPSPRAPARGLDAAPARSGHRGGVCRHDAARRAPARLTSKRRDNDEGEPDEDEEGLMAVDRLFRPLVDKFAELKEEDQACVPRLSRARGACAQRVRNEHACVAAARVEPRLTVRCGWVVPRPV